MRGRQSGTSVGEVDIIACLAMAGASEPINLAAARDYEHPFLHAIFTTDAHADSLADMEPGTVASLSSETVARVWRYSVGRCIASADGAFLCPMKEAGHGSAAKQRVAFCGPMTDAFHGPVIAKAVRAL